MEAIRPLFASTSGDFSPMGDTSKQILRHIGQILINLRYKGAVIDPEFKPTDSDDEKGDIGALYETSKQVSTIYPILQHGSLSSVRKVVRKHCVKAAQVAMVSFECDTHIRIAPEGDAVAPGDMADDEQFSL